MTQSPFYLSLSLIIGVVCASGWPLAAQNRSTAKSSSSIFVNGIPLPVNEPSETLLRQLFVTQHHREPLRDEDKRQLAEQAEQFFCNSLRTKLDEAAKAEAKKKLGIFATSSDIESARAEVLRGVDAVAAARQVRERASAVSAALSEVYEKGRDPDEVYRSMLKGKKLIDEATWALHLFKGKDPTYRTQLQREMNMTPELITASAMRMDLKSIVEHRKLEAAVDKEIADQDKTFRAYVGQASNREFHGASSAIEYVQQKRGEYWRRRVSELHVALGDSSLYGRCGLAAMGVRAATR